MSKIEDKIREIASQSPKSDWKKQVEYRRANKSWLKKSAEIALRVLDALEDKGWNQAKLAEALGVSAQQVSKIVRGRENFTLETLEKLETVLEVELCTVLKENEIVVEKKQKEVPEFVPKKGSVFTAHVSMRSYAYSSRSIYSGVAA